MRRAMKRGVGAALVHHRGRKPLWRLCLGVRSGSLKLRRKRTAGACIAASRCCASRRCCWFCSVSRPPGLCPCTLGARATKAVGGSAARLFLIFMRKAFLELDFGYSGCPDKVTRGQSSQQFAGIRTDFIVAMSNFDVAVFEYS